MPVKLVQLMNGSKFVQENANVHFEKVMKILLLFFRLFYSPKCAGFIRTRAAFKVITLTFSFYRLA